jgi:hypothetical protein
MFSMTLFGVAFYDLLDLLLGQYTKALSGIRRGRRSFRRHRRVVSEVLESHTIIHPLLR